MFDPRLPARSVVLVTAPLVIATAAILSACGGQASGDNTTPTATATASPTEPPVVATAPPDTSTPTPSPTPTATPHPQLRFDEELLLLASKQHELGSAYVPNGLVYIDPAWAAPGFGGMMLRDLAADALTMMLTAAQEAGHEIRVRSAYRSYEEQVYTFQYWVSQHGEEQARRQSAEPGKSEHQLGTVVDLTSASVGWALSQEFGDTPEGQWLMEHAHEYGFALSYPEGAEATTGYIYEPWHWRYIGPEHARRWHESGMTLIEYLLSVQNGVG